jgi:hypothetical protein
MTFMIVVLNDLRLCFLLFAFFLFAGPTYAQTTKRGVISPSSILSVDTAEFEVPSVNILEDDSLQEHLNKKKLLVRQLSFSQERVGFERQIDSLRSYFESKAASIPKLSYRDPFSKMISKLAVRSGSSQLPGAALRRNVSSSKNLDTLQSKIETKFSKPQTKINEKLSAFQSNGMTGLSTDLKLPSPSVSVPSGGGDIGNIGIPNNILDKSTLGNASLPDANLPSPNLSTKPFQLPSIQEKLPTGEIPVNTNRISDVSEQIKNHQESLKDVTSEQAGKLSVDKLKITPEQIEEKIADLDEVEEVKKQVDLVDQMKRYHDPEVAKEEALNKVKKDAVNHFAGHEEELKAAMEKLSKLKAKLPDTEGVVDLFVKRQHPLSHLTFLERLTPGLSLQFQQLGSFWLDINPHIAYKISGRFTSGLGWNERFAYNFDNMQWDAKNHIYGLRGFVQFKFKTNFWFKGEAEIMNSPLRATPLLSSDVVGRGWVVSYFGGIKKDFNLTKHLKGNVHMLYNLYNPDKRSPYVNRFNVRMGFELPLKKKAKPKNEMQ